MIKGKALMGIIVLLVCSAGIVSAEIDSSAGVTKPTVPVTEEIASRQVIIGFEKDVVSMQAQDAFITKHGGRVLKRNTELNYVLIEVAKGKKAQDFIKELTSVRKGEMGIKIRYAEPNGIVTILHTPNDPLYTSQWGPAAIKADHAWDIQKGSSGVTIAIVDTGIDYTHEDLGNYVSGGYDWVNNDDDPMDDHYHGTHCAGIATAVMDNNVGIAGIAQVSVMAEKVLNSAGRGYTADVAEGIIHAANSGASVISLSLGSSSFSQTMCDACQYAWDAGCVIVAASGNGNGNIIYPAAYDSVIAVGAMNENHERCDPSDWGEGRGSCYGPQLELIAPGDNILSTVPLFKNATGYEAKRGTSMACPHVAGVAALVFSNCSSFTNADVREHLNYTVDDLGEPGWDQYYGWGRVNVERAIDCGPTIPDISINPGSFDVEIVEQGVREYPLTIANEGTGILTVTLYDTIGNMIEIFSDDLESGAGCWTHGGDQDEWELGTPTYASGPPGAHSGSNCWGTDLSTTYNNDANQWLMTESFDLSDTSSANVSFYRWHALEVHPTMGYPYDFGYVEISTNGTYGPWTQLIQYTGYEEEWIFENIDISDYTGIGSEDVRIRFRVTSDSSVKKAGLYIDDLSIRIGDWLSVSPTEYPVYSGMSINVTVTCDTLGHDLGDYNGTIVVTSNDPDEGQVNVTVNMTILPGGDPEIWVDPQSFDLNIGWGLLTENNLTIGNSGDGILWLYNITDDADWLSESPEKGRVYVSDKSNITLSFDTTELALGNYNTTIVVTNNDSDENPTNVPVNITVAPPDIRTDPESFEIEVPKDVTTMEGLKIKNDGLGLLEFEIKDTTTITFLDDDMESGVGGWTHGGDQDEWELGTPTYGPDGAYSGDSCWGTDLDGNFNGDSDQWLMTESFDLSGVTSPTTLSFCRWYELEYAFDYGYVEISQNGTAGPWEQLARYNDDNKGSWVHETIDITTYTGSSDVRIGFRVASDNVQHHAGMYIDDVIVEWGGWLSCEPTSGSLYSGENTSIDVTISPLDVGIHNATIVITNNDPDCDPKNVSVNITVQPAEILVDPEAGFDVELNTGETWNDTLDIVNNGPGLLWYGPLSEGFEGGVMPAGWAQVVTGTPTWAVTTDPDYVHSGSYGAVCKWGYDPYTPQDEWLITRPLNMSLWSNATLSFQWWGSYTWMVTPYDYYDLFVKVSVDDGRNWETVWDCDEIGEFSYKVWYDTTFGTPIDLSAYEGNSSVLIAWNYVGDNGHDFALDDLVIRVSPNQSMSWLDIDPRSGIVNASDHDNITVSIDAAGLASGDYRGDIVIDNNDPGKGPVIVPVNLTVHVQGTGCVAADGTVFPCGSTVTKSCTLDGDMLCPSSTYGLAIGADDIVIDGAGYKITGNVGAADCGSGYYPPYTAGESNPAKHSGVIVDAASDVVITNLEIAGFCTGIGIALGRNTTVMGCDIHDNGNAASITHGIQMICPRNCTIWNNSIYNNTGNVCGCGGGGNGVFMYGGSAADDGDHNNITHNDLANNTKAGVLLKKKCAYNVIEYNNVTGHEVGGIVLRCGMSDHNVVRYNNISDNLGSGIFLRGTNNTVRNNTVTGSRNGSQWAAICEGLTGDVCGSGVGVRVHDDATEPKLYNNTICDNEYWDIEDNSGNLVGDDNTCAFAHNYHDASAGNPPACVYQCPDVWEVDLQVINLFETWHNETYYNITYTVVNYGWNRSNATDTGIRIDDVMVDVQPVPELDPRYSYTNTSGPHELS